MKRRHIMEGNIFELGMELAEWIVQSEPADYMPLANPAEHEGREKRMARLQAAVIGNIVAGLPRPEDYQELIKRVFTETQ